MVLLAAMVIYAGQSIFSSIILAYEIGQSGSSTHVNVDKEKLDSVYNYAFNKESVSLEIK
jgi:hypothetical protein